MPSVDKKYNLGDPKRRWRLIRGVTMTPGDLVFENGVKTTEEKDGLAFFNPEGSKIALLDSQGNFHIKGRVIKDSKKLQSARLSFFSSLHALLSSFER
jgi:hypothetical protein